MMEASTERMMERVREIYRGLTGADLPEPHGPGEPIPAGWDAAQFVRNRWLELEALVSAAALPVAPLWSPRFDAFELEREHRLDFEVPGVAREDITVAVVEGRLVVEGLRRAPQIPGGNGWGYRWRELPIGVFRREVPLPMGVRVDQLDAKLEEGLLKVRLPHAKIGGRRERVEIH
jgi:HSP20 family protein